MMNRELIDELRKTVAIAAGDYDLPGAEQLASRIKPETKDRLLAALELEVKGCLPPDELEREAQEFRVELDKFMGLVLDEAVMSGRRCANIPDLFKQRNTVQQSLAYLFDSARRNERKRIVDQLDKTVAAAFRQVNW